MVKSILFIEAITKADKILIFVLDNNLIVQKVIKTRVVLKTYIFQRGIIKYISEINILKTKLTRYKANENKAKR
ncbi:hypothetical protein N8376_02375 [Flavobacteriaceae bacterium]|jgi:hypothetical protein|nr:hypothetical protein [Flavobacteriaceae bacterium]